MERFVIKQKIEHYRAMLSEQNKVFARPYLTTASPTRRGA